MRRDGSEQGPLDGTTIQEWSKQRWIGRVQELEQCVHEVRSEKQFLAGQVQGLLQSVGPPLQAIALQEQKRKTAPCRRQRDKVKQNLKSSSRQTFQASASRPPVRTRDVRPAHNTKTPDLALESPPPTHHNQM
ncbi:schlafen-like protein 1 [Lates japonicus]|uniref:Schlafen-like protein 1 n=1 Tax=Lates japonicus TaxID=270547 RepID=A0AAD3MWU4_LATJO|nr:schlafen-like protein 1 [Lates japonicus]